MIFKNKRSEIEIIGKILTKARQESKKTSLLYNTNLCYSHFLEYLDFLIDKNFIDVKNGKPHGNSSRNTYYVTEKGEKFLHCIENVIYLAK